MPDFSHRTGRNGFTLVELLVVIGIIAVLTALIVSGAGMLRQKAKITVTGKRMDQLVMGLQTYTASGGTVATALQRLVVQSVPELAPLREVLGELLNSRWTPGLWTAGSQVMPNFYYNNTGGDVRVEVRARFYPGNNDHSMFGESLNETLEVYPDISLAPNRPAKTWYRSKWPKAWPAADWTSTTPGSVPTVWETPWGKPTWKDTTTGAYVWRDGTLDTTPVARNLSQLDPLKTVELLLASGMLDSTDGANAFYTNRSASRAWNDAWGNPLILAVATFHPPRHDTLNVDSASNNDVPYLRPRDFLLTRSRELFGYPSSLYISVGSMGQTPAAAVMTAAGATATLTWSAANHRKVMQQAWIDITTTCSATEWNESSFTTPPWTGVRKGVSAGRTCLILAPTEIR